MATNNYFRVQYALTDGVFPFDDASPMSTQLALASAVAVARARDVVSPIGSKATPYPRAVCLWRLPKVPGPWARYPVIGEAPPAKGVW